MCANTMWFTNAKYKRESMRTNGRSLIHRQTFAYRLADFTYAEYEIVKRRFGYLFHLYVARDNQLKNRISIDQS